MDRKTDYVALGVVFGFSILILFSLFFSFLFFSFFFFFSWHVVYQLFHWYDLDVNICTHIKTNYKVDFDHLDYL
jgi:hypothetical protein